MDRSTRWVLGLGVGLVLGGAAAWWAGSVLDAPLTGQQWRLGPWAVIWGAAAFLVGIAAGARDTFGLVVLALVSGLVAVGAWSSVIVYRAPVWSLEGAWLYPVAVASSGTCWWAVRRAG